MKKYLVIGNPIEHSLSPKLHSYWIKKNNIDAIYEKEKLDENDLENLILKVKDKIIHGINVTVPFKKTVIPYMDKLTIESENTQSVNTIYLENELPDTINIFSNSDNVLSIGAGNNVLEANIDVSGDFYIRYQSFKSFLEIGNIADTATIYLTGNGNFSSSNDGTMDLTFSEPNLPGQIECSILLTKLD